MMTSVNSGVVALSTEARPLATAFWPNVMKEKGSTLLRMLITTNGIHSVRVAGRRSPTARTSGSRKAAASATRASTMVKAGSSFTATPTKKNEPPQRTDKTSSSSHWVRDMSVRGAIRGA